MTYHWTQTLGRTLALTALALLLACDAGNKAIPDDDVEQPGTPPPNISQGGANGTVFSATTQAFAMPLPGLSGERLNQHLVGDAAFEAVFVAAPAQVNPGLGPLFNNISCESCHPADGRGRPPQAGENRSAMFLRMSLPDPSGDPSHGPIPVPGYGTQLFDQGLFGVTPQGRMQISYEEQPGTYADGTAYSLRRPSYSVADPYRELPPDLLLSPRVAPPVFGRGLLELIPQSAILANQDPNDLDRDGISGRPNWVTDAASGELALGRFGWKGDNPNLRQQNAGAYRGDIGVTNTLFTEESVAGEPQDDNREDDPELPAATLEAVTHYVRTLAVPARRNYENANVIRGQSLFQNLACADCHIPEWQTVAQSAELPELTNQTIYPYTDTLLHDMGPGLADGRPVFAASGTEWKTPPLWGIGLTGIVNGHNFFLHDGRARSIEEAILWHGGEAEESSRRFKNLSAQDRQALLAFLNSL